MGQSSIMKFLKEDKELLEMREEWKELGIGRPFPPFNYDEYDGTDGYKKTIRKTLTDYIRGKRREAHISEMS
ncbi:hypothetical protein AALA00_13880 [Lachnospiraceae bacterium 46-15]